MAKEYDVSVLGNLGPIGTCGHIDIPLDGKSARTDYEVTSMAPDGSSSALRVHMLSGRYHQIRRHFAGIGHPVLGDPKYGSGNADPRGLQLIASRVAFDCPWSGARVVVTVPPLATCA